MSADAIMGSKQIEDETSSSTWIFGYGSLVWRPAFQYVQLRPGYIKSYKRRFWQGSTDHRGVPEAPGRVVTLIHQDEADFNHPLDQTPASMPEVQEHSYVWGICYEVSPEKVKETLEYLDFREKGGYTRTLVNVFDNPNDHSPTLKNVLLYTATTENEEYLGPAPLLDIAKQISISVGPSGPNTEYLFQLHEALVKNAIHDHHISELYQLVLSISQKPIESSS
jgi:cation transport regulator ChaC